jgi:hypothetical protein
MLDISIVLFDLVPCMLLVVDRRLMTSSAALADLTSMSLMSLATRRVKIGKRSSRSHRQSLVGFRAFQYRIVSVLDVRV